MYRNRITISLLICMLCGALSAQNIALSYLKSDELFVCGNDTFRVTVTNNGAVALSNAKLTMTMPSGLAYVPGTVMLATEQNISNLAAPVFAMPDVPAGQSRTFKVLLEANCGAADVLDAGQLFIAQLAFTSNQGNVQVTTTSIPVETAAIIVESISPAVLTGERFDTLTRTICVRNTRLGKVNGLFFEDQHPTDVSVRVLAPLGQNVAPTLTSGTFDGSFFQTVGNGDTWLDLNEQFCFNEEVVINGCGAPPGPANSLVRIGWGCGTELCRYDSAVALVEVTPSTKVPNLVFEPIWSPPVDYCGQIPAVMGYKIYNIGKASAQQVFLDVSLIESLAQAGIKPGSERFVTNAGAIPVSPNISDPNVLGECGQTVIFHGAYVIPELEAGDTLLFLFDVITCVAPCYDAQPAFRCNFFYSKECPPNGFVSDFSLIVPPVGYTVRGEVLSGIGTCMQSGSTYNMGYKVVSAYLQTDGFMHIRLELPPGVTIDPSCGTNLSGVAPALQEITPMPDGGQSVHLAWATPFAADSVNMEFCLHYECDTNAVCVQLPAGSETIYTENCCLQPFGNTTYWTPSLATNPDCGINHCRSQYLSVDRSCVMGGDIPPPDSTCCDTIIPAPDLLTWWDVYRLNLDLLDDNDDRKADALLPANPALARRDRFLPGDTLRVEFCATVKPGGHVSEFSRAIWHEIVGADMGINGSDAFNNVLAQHSFMDNERFMYLRNTIRIKYADGTSDLCNWAGDYFDNDENFYQLINPNTFPVTVLDNVVTQKFHFAFVLTDLFAQGCISKPELTEGDSIFVYTDFKIDINFKPVSTNTPDPPLIGFRTATSSGGLIYAWNNQPFKQLQYSGWRKTIAPNAHSIKPCENSVEPKKFRYSLRIARENMFPFEVRPLARVMDLRETKPVGLELLSAQAEYLVLQDSVPYLNNVTLPFSETPGDFTIDFAPLYTDPIDEGYTLRTRIAFKPNCQFTVPDTSRQYVDTRFNGCLNGDNPNVLDSLKNAIGYFSFAPLLQLTSPDTLIHSPTEPFSVDLTLNNLVVSQAPITWLSIISPSGELGDFKLFQLPQNQAITPVNGLYFPGNLGGFSHKDFRLEGKNLSCNTDTLLIVYGWDCSVPSGLSAVMCGRDTLLIQLNLEKPELELDVVQEPASITLCDTSDWFEFVVYNAKTGYAYDLEAFVKLPQGLLIIPGSCQISYPEGAPWVNIPDPTPQSGNLFHWDINAVQAVLAANGLAGVNLDPQNAFHIRFKTTAECGFVANTPIIYGTTGEEPCGLPANVLNKPGEPLLVEGLSPTYGVQLGLQPDNGAVVCGGTQHFSVNLNILGTPSASDSIYIYLPQGVTYENNSYQPGQNAVPGPPQVTANGFRLPLPVLQGGGTVHFEFDLHYGANAGCSDLLIQAQTRVRSEAFCQSLGVPCAVYIVTGEAFWNVSLEHPQLTIQSADIHYNAGTGTAQVQLQNNGQLTANGATVQIWRDTDGNGVFSTGDQLLGTLHTDDQIGAGQGLDLSGVLNNLDTTQLCGLFAFLPGSENCMCDDQLLPINNIAWTHAALIDCQLQPLQLGVAAQPGFTYQWQPAGNLACPQCANTLYTPPSGVATDALTLIESGPGCTVQHSYTISFGASVELQTAQTAVCAGNPVLLSVSTPGTGYNWSGPGISNPAAATQTVIPQQQSDYAVTVTLSNGCTASDTIQISILKADTVVLSTLQTCSGEPVAVLGNVTDVAGVYQAVFSNTAGCDSLVIQSLEVFPKAEAGETISFCLGDTLFVADTLFTASGAYCRTFSTVHGCDSTYCITANAIAPPAAPPSDTIYAQFGEQITLTGPDGYSAYSWQPAPVPPCPNCQQVTYTADSTGYFEYILTVAGPEGCPGDLIFRLLVLPPCNYDSLDIPNAFTPNGDGFNDVFRVVPYEGSEVVSGLEIYDRWGEKVYDSAGSTWDGTIHQKPAPSDVYVYIVYVQCGALRGKRIGDVTLLR